MRRGHRKSAAGGIRTLKPLRAAGFEPALYASSSTAAGEVRPSRYQPGATGSRYRPVTGIDSQDGGDGHGRTLPAVNRNLLERRLRELSVQLRELRQELTVVDEQLESLAGVADDARLRSLVSETPLAEREHREASRHADAMSRHRSEVVSDIARLEQQQDDLLDRISGTSD